MAPNFRYGAIGFGVNEYSPLETSHLVQLKGVQACRKILKLSVI